LFDSTGAATKSLGFAGGTAKATVTDSKGNPVTGKIVSFSGDVALIKFVSPATGNVLTDSQGVASIQVSPASLNAAGGAGTLKSTVTTEGVALAASLDFQLAAANISLMSLDVGTTSLPTYGNRPVSVYAALDGIITVSNPVQVTFAASCGVVNPVNVATDGAGKAATTYTANSVACAGSNVTITASASGATSATGVIAVDAVAGSNLLFVSATPSRIYLQGSVGATQSMLVFKVIDSGGSALQNQAVVLSLTNSAAGTSIGSPGNNSPVIKSTDATGLVSVPVFSGSIPTSVQVKAVLQSNPTVTSLSNTLTVASGRPVQSRASLSTEKLSIEGWDFDGSTTKLTMRLADRQGNPVPDGTEVNFVTNGGFLTPPTCTVSGGSSACSVTLNSSNPRPVGGRVTILAYAPGEEDFVDFNGNGVYDLGETFTDIGNAYRDDNANNQYDAGAGEFLVPRAGTSLCVTGIGKQNSCDGVWGVVDVRASVVVIFAGSGAEFGNISTTTPNVVPATPTVRDTLSFRVQDTNGHGVPGGSTVTARARGTVCTTGAVVPATILDSQSPTNVVVALSGCSVNDAIDLTVITPTGRSTTVTVNLP
jgi:hypothetical protein